MSRRSALSPQDDRRWVFNRVADDYAARPGYPALLVDRLAALCGPGGRVAELGAGTGHLALPLASRGLRVTAVEPARAMLARLARAAPPSVTPVQAAAEATGLPGRAFDLVVLADALQWVDPEGGAAEIRRLLVPGGALAVVTPRFRDTPFHRALGALLAAANPKARAAPPPVDLLFSLAGLPAPAEESFPLEVVLGPEALDAVLRSLSYVGPALGPARLAALLAAARRLAAELGPVWSRELALAWSRGGRPTRPAAGAPRASGPPPRAAARAPRPGGGGGRRRGGHPGRGGR